MNLSIRTPLLGALVIACLGCESENLGLGYGEGTFHQSVNIGRDLRDYVVYVPSSVKPGTPAPLVLVFHGANDTADNMMLLSWLNQEASKRGAVVAYLDALNATWEMQSSRDIIFAGTVINRVQNDLAIDTTKIFATGFSNGALFALNLACLPPTPVKAVAMVGATVPTTQACSLVDPIPSLMILGDEDPAFPFRPQSGLQGQLSADASVTFLKNQNRCGGDRVLTQIPDEAEDGTSTQRWTYPLCTRDNSVEFYHVRGGGHTWPGSPLRLPPNLGRKSRDFAAHEVIMKFFLDRDDPAAITGGSIDASGGAP